MSKSQGNAVDPRDILRDGGGRPAALVPADRLAGLGADPLRPRGGEGGAAQAAGHAGEHVHLLHALREPRRLRGAGGRRAGDRHGAGAARPLGAEPPADRGRRGARGAGRAQFHPRRQGDRGLHRRRRQQLVRAALPAPLLEGRGHARQARRLHHAVHRARDVAAPAGAVRAVRRRGALPRPARARRSGRLGASGRLPAARRGAARRVARGADGRRPGSGRPWPRPASGGRAAHPATARTAAGAWRRRAGGAADGRRGRGRAGRRGAQRAGGRGAGRPPAGADARRASQLPGARPALRPARAAGGAADHGDVAGRSGRPARRGAGGGRSGGGTPGDHRRGSGGDRSRRAAVCCGQRKRLYRGARHDPDRRTAWTRVSRARSSTGCRTCARRAVWRSRTASGWPWPARRAWSGSWRRHGARITGETLAESVATEAGLPHREEFTVDDVRIVVALARRSAEPGGES